MFKIRFGGKADFKIEISKILLLVFIAFLSCGFGSSKEENYIKSEDFGEGLKYVEKRLLKNQKDPSANYYAGRYLLAMNRQEEALPHLLQAVLLDVGKAKYHFWLGVSYWALRDFDKERKAYQRAIAIDFRYRSAHLYLGHNYFDSGEWNKALKQYEKVLELEKKHPDALFNRAVAIKELGRMRQAILAWKEYLKYYPDGKWALKAVHNLNLRGDFSYRNYLLGARRVVLSRIAFEPDSARLKKASLPSLDVVRAMLSNNKALKFYVITYCQKNTDLARQRALSIKKYITFKNPGVGANRVILSWFGFGEVIKKNGKSWLEKESVNFIAKIK